MIMRLITFIILLIAIPFAARGQVTYQTLNSDPSVVNDGYLSLVGIGVDAGFGNLTGASIWSVGADVLYPINDKLKIETMALYSLFSLGNEGPPFLLSAGAEYNLKSSTKQQDLPVLLSMTVDTDWYEGTQTTSYSAVALPGMMKTDYVARGGIYTRNSALEYEQGTTFYDPTNLFMAGVYAGVGMNKSFFVQAQDSKGNKFGAGRLLRMYGDVMIIPASADLSLNGVQATEVSETFGWRVGALIQTVPFGKEDNFGNKINLLGKFTLRVEAGQRPIEGFFVTTTLGWVLKRF